MRTKRTTEESKRVIAIRDARKSEIARDSVLKALGEKCKICGFDDKRALQIDHVHGGGRKDIKQRRMNSRRYYKLILDEIQNGSNDYQILCANCNWIKRHENKELNIKYEDRTLPPKKQLDPHGTYGSYSRGCRCELCVEARRKYEREWYAGKRIYNV